MKKRINSIISILLVVALLIGFIGSIPASASEAVPTMVIDSVQAVKGRTTSVKLSVENNPGMAAATFRIVYDDSILNLDSVDFNTDFGGDFDELGSLSLPVSGSDTLRAVQISWSSMSDISIDGTFLTMNFSVDENVPKNSAADIAMVFSDGDFCNINEEDINFTPQNGRVTVIEGIPGDINGDKTVNSKDLIRLRKYFTGWDVEVDILACDCNGDGNVNSKDLIRLRKYFSGWDVELFYGSNKTVLCNHSMEKIEAKRATCTEDGNIDYWHCKNCGKYFIDDNGSTEILLEDTVIAATGHTVVIDESVSATSTSTGLTEGSHCSVCNETIVEQQVIPIIKGYSIKYNIANGDNYLMQQTIDNSQNPNEYFKEDDTIYLNGLEAPSGYQFLGWFDGQGENAVRIKEIKSGSTGNIELYAHWNKISYTITFKSDMVPVPDKVYTADQEVVLETPKLDKYTFVGWSDKAGKIWDVIPAGTAENITLYANWASNRNKASKVSEPKDPIILEDSENGLILFTYEIGAIENVPLFTTLKLNCVNGIITENSKTNEKAISEESAKTVAQTISNATTNSSSWTLEKNWNNTTQVSESYLDQTGQTREEAETLAKSQSNTYNLSTSSGGSSTTTDASAGSFKLSGNQAHSETDTTETGQNFNLSVDAKYSREKSSGMSLGIPIEGLNVGINAGKKSTFEIGAGVDYGNYIKNTNTGTDSWSNGLELSGQTSHSSTDEKNWNTTSGYSSSNSTSMSSSVSNTISTLISKQYGYGKEYSEGGSNSESQQFASTDSKSDEFSTTLTYYSSDIESTTTTYSSTGNTKGDYRLVMAGKVHVFAVVGYDVATKSYFVYTYNVLDDKTEEYLDYSYDGTFNDYETSIIPFEVPSFVNDFVNNRIAMTDGLRIDPDTGIIDKYTPPVDGAATIISVPSYVSLDNGDGTYRSVKVRGISPELFRGNTDVVGVILGHNIKEIPDNAFEDCTSLKYVISPNVTKIGSNAFKNCISLERFSVPLEVTQVGSNAFENVPAITVNACNADVAKSLASSGAQNTVLDISSLSPAEAEDLEITVGAVTSFELQGKDKEYRNLRIRSDAETTIINGVKIPEATRIPLELSSHNITLNRVNVNSSGYAMLLTADETNITLNTTNNFTASSGNTVVCRNIKLSPLSVSVVGKMCVDGKMLICGDIEGMEFLECDNIEYIDEAAYSQYKQGMFNITLNANGGEVSDTAVTAYFGTAIGTLPTPTRENCTFDGWYTEDGTEITGETTYNYLTDITLRAHWTSDWVKADEMPSDGQVIDTKWTYTLREYKESASSSLSGYTKYDTKRTSWGSTQGPVYSDPSNGSRNVWSEAYVTSSNYKTVYHYFRYSTSQFGSGGSDKSGTSYGSNYYTYNFDYALTNTGSMGNYARGYKYYYNAATGNTVSGSYITVWQCSPLTTQEWVSDNYGTRWYYQDPVYTYYYYRDVSKEATSDPTGQSNVSNVVKYVKYRAK